MLEKVSNYINDNEFRFTVYREKLHIMNYKRMITLEENYIFLSSEKEKIRIWGKNLKLQKILNKEILITGNIEKIEVENE